MAAYGNVAQTVKTYADYIKGPTQVGSALLRCNRSGSKLVLHRADPATLPLLHRSRSSYPHFYPTDPCPDPPTLTHAPQIQIHMSLSNGLALGSINSVLAFAYAASFFFGAYAVADFGSNGGRVVTAVLASLIGGFALGLVGGWVCGEGRLQQRGPHGRRGAFITNWLLCPGPGGGVAWWVLGGGRGRGRAWWVQRREVGGWPGRCWGGGRVVAAALVSNIGDLALECVRPGGC